MPTEKSNEWLPDPFENLLRYETSGSVRMVGTMLSTDKKWFEANLSEENLSRCASIAARLDQWKAIEAVHGEGSALNPDHQVLANLISSVESWKRDYEPLLANAHRFKAFMDDNWLWHQS
ncbi:hypothetical protein [Rhizobium lusitanum]|uniref:Uncharacterized protein n=1 Tax=Rhizobium lusitanum TaxID=293958 RepID=A0A7X0IVF0_9HYPH|nr:hypothetical protein [Rhizobium lusitanum]MBB6487923.1 hypothetical protein [Rhizobium lusitanum]